MWVFDASTSPAKEAVTRARCAVVAFAGEPNGGLISSAPFPRPDHHTGGPPRRFHYDLGVHEPVVPASRW